MSSFLGIHTAYSGIRAAQAGLETTSNNIANVSTRGYTRQRVELVTSHATLTAAGYIGEGVDIEAINRLRDGFLDERARTELGRSGRLSRLADMLGRTEGVFGELQFGVSNDLDDVFAALEDLANNPDSAGARQVVISRLDGLATRIRSIATGYEAIAANAGNDLLGETREVNQLLRRVAELNTAILGARPGGQPNDLLDERDRVIDDIVERTGARVLHNEDGSVRLTLDGEQLVDRALVNELTASADGTITHPAVGAVTLGGTLGGIQEFLASGIASLQAELDTFATDLATSFNDQHAAGFTDSGAAGGPLFTIALGTARTFQVAVSSPDELAVHGDATAARFDGDNAQALADLRNVAGSSGSVITEDLQALVSSLGASVGGAQTAANHQAQVAGAAEAARMSEHGVNLDEEFVSLIAFQRQLEAASRVMTSIDQALDVLINRTGVVGR